MNENWQGLIHEVEQDKIKKGKVVYYLSYAMGFGIVMSVVFRINQIASATTAQFDTYQIYLLGSIIFSAIVGILLLICLARWLVVYLASRNIRTPQPTTSE